MVEEERLTDRYVLVERIAVGGMGGVYVARDERLNRRVAVKILKDDLAQDPRFVERFRREARSVAALSHPNVAAVYDYGEENERRFIVMELVEGRDLARVLRESGPLDPERAARIAAGAARALEHAHAAGMIHRDVKPANIIVSPGDRVKVTDFGIARAAGESTLTATGSVMGTAQYISPEQAAGDPVSPSSDVYSLGIVLFEMLTGSVPFSGDNALAVAMKHVNETVPPPSERNPDVPPALDSIVARATEMDPRDRYGNVSRLAEELETMAVSLEAGGDTRELATEEDDDQTIWPIPGTRYDPELLGKRVIGALVALAFVALALLVWRIATADPAADRDERSGNVERRAGGDGQQTDAQATPSPEETGFTLDDYTGQNYKDVEAVLTEAGLVVGKEDVESDAEKDSILAQSPEAGTEVEEGATVTLTVSTGKPPDEDDSSGPPEDAPGEGKAKGHDKDKGKGKDGDEGDD